MSSRSTARSSRGRRAGRPPLPARPADPLAPVPAVVRSDAGLWGYERALRRHGFPDVAGADEAGRGACAGPLVVAAVVLPDGRRGQVPGLADSKLLTEQAREQVYAEVVRRASSWHVVCIPAPTVDRIGLHIANLAGMRRAVAGLAVRPSYVLTDGFPVPGLGAPSCAVWKGDRVAACVAAASVVAKVTRDRIMCRLAEQHPEYAFERHKGYSTPEHGEALREHGPCPEHRFSYVNVASAMRDDGDELAVVTDDLSDELDGDLDRDLGAAVDDDDALPAETLVLGQDEGVRIELTPSGWAQVPA